VKILTFAFADFSKPCDKHICRLRRKKIEKTKDDEPIVFDDETTQTQL